MNKKQSRKERALRVGHTHSPPVRKAEIVAHNVAQGLRGVSLSSGDLHGSLHLAKAKSPTHGAYAPIHGQGQGPVKQRAIPTSKRKFDGAKVIKPVPERSYKMHRNRKGFRPFNPTGKA